MRSLVLLFLLASCHHGFGLDDYSFYEDDWYNDELGKLISDDDDTKEGRFYDYNRDYDDTPDLNIELPKSQDSLVQNEGELDTSSNQEKLQENNQNGEEINDYQYEDNRSELKESSESVDGKNVELLDLPLETKNYENAEEVINDDSNAEEVESILNDSEELGEVSNISNESNDISVKFNNDGEINENIKSTNVTSLDKEDETVVEKIEEANENNDSEDNLDLSVALDDFPKTLNEQGNINQDFENIEGIEVDLPEEQTLDDDMVQEDLPIEKTGGDDLPQKELLIEKDKDSNENLNWNLAADYDQVINDEKQSEISMEEAISKENNYENNNSDESNAAIDKLLPLRQENENTDFQGQENNDEGDTIAKVFSDLNADLDKLSETWSKLTDDESKELVFGFDAQSDEIEDKLNDMSQNENTNDYENIDDTKFDELFKKESSVETNLYLDDTEIDEKTLQDEINAIINNLSEENNPELLSVEENVQTGFEVAENDALITQNQSNEVKSFGELEPESSSIEEDIKSIEETQPVEETQQTSHKSVMYSNDDALVADDVPEPIQAPNSAESSNAETNSSPETVDTLLNLNEQEAGLEPDTKKPTETSILEDLSSDEIDELNDKFAKDHEKELDTLSEDFDRNVAPIHIHLSVDEATEVTSPNYPNNYPTGNTVDWIFDGEGEGIEMNITELSINSLLEHYLLVKPGGEDASGTDGLIFAYDLTSPRRYRFLDVNKMFVRFHAGSGMPFKKGFVFSVKMISPKRSSAIVEAPEEELTIPSPTATLTVALGGMSLYDFLQIQEEFRVIVANMATLYINENHLQTPDNTTYEATQITKIDVCNLVWPDSENCSLVTFGVPLVYREQEQAEPRLNHTDLHLMWTSYSRRDPFALSLRRLGIVEFAPPEDTGVLIVWVIIGTGVLISIAMLAVALWRFSCFEGYTRMPLYSDTDSVSSKRGPALFPAPHQQLPALQGDHEYKPPYFSHEETKVDVGGFANRSYANDNLYQFDSDDEVIVSREGSIRVNPDEIYKL